MAKKPVEVQEAVQEVRPTEASVGASELAAALVAAINSTKSPEKKTPVNRKVNTPWTPKDGSPKLKLKRKMFQHGISIDEDMITNEEVTLLNKLRQGVFLDGWVKVNRRRNDKGLDIIYPVKTAAQRLKLVNMYGIRNLKELVARCIHEAENPKDYSTDDHDE